MGVSKRASREAARRGCPSRGVALGSRRAHIGRLVRVVPVIPVIPRQRRARRVVAYAHSGSGVGRQHRDIARDGTRRVGPTRHATSEPAWLANEKGGAGPSAPGAPGLLGCAPCRLLPCAPFSAFFPSPAGARSRRRPAGHCHGPRVGSRPAAVSPAPPVKARAPTRSARSAPARVARSGSPARAVPARVGSAAPAGQRWAVPPSAAAAARAFPRWAASRAKARAPGSISFGVQIDGATVVPETTYTGAVTAWTDGPLFLKLGRSSYGGNNVFPVWHDDVVVSPTPVGCAP